MDFDPQREQLLANLKCLYGSNVDVVTFRVDVPYDGCCQAIAMSFDPDTTTWTKFLHSDPKAASCARNAIRDLLEVSEKELAKLFSANGNTVPFQEAMTQTVTLRRGQPTASSTRDSVGSFELVDTPGSSLPDTAPDQSIDEEHPVAVTACENPLVDEASVDIATVEEEAAIPVSEAAESPCAAPEPIADGSESTGFDWGTWGTSKKDKKKKKARFVLDEWQPAVEYPTVIPIEEHATEAPSQRCPADISTEEPHTEATVEKCRIEEESSAEDAFTANYIIEEVPACPPESEAPSLEDLDTWGSFTPSKKDRKKQGREPIKEEISILRSDIEPAPSTAGFGSWGSSWSSGWNFGAIPTEGEPKEESEDTTLTMEECEKRQLDQYPQSESEPALQPEEAMPVVELELAQEPEPTPEPTDDWSFSSKSKKKKATKWTEEEMLAVEPELQPVPEPESVLQADEKFDWGFSPIPKNKKKKDTMSNVEKIPAPGPELTPATEEPVDEFGWGAFTTSKKKKEKTMAEEEVPAPEPESVPEPVEDPWSISSTSKKGKKAKKMTAEVVTSPEPALAPQPEEHDDWASWGISKRKKKAKMLAEDKVATKELTPAPEPFDDIWLPPISKKTKKKGNKKLIEEEKVIPSQLETVLDPVEEVEEPKRAESPAAASTPAPESPTGTGHDVSEPLSPRAPVQAESVQVARSRYTVVLTMQLPNDTSYKPLQVLTTVADNTRTAILEAVNLYLDSKSMLKSLQSQRKVEIISAVGRNGDDVDLSTLEETMWPEYLDYFRQYTRIPELTVHVMEC